MTDREKAFWRDMFEYRKATYYPVFEDGYWKELVEAGEKLADKYKGEEFYDFALSVIASHQHDVSRRYNQR